MFSKFVAAGGHRSDEIASRGPFPNQSCGTLGWVRWPTRVASARTKPPDWPFARPEKTKQARLCGAPDIPADVLADGDFALTSDGLAV